MRILYARFTLYAFLGTILLSQTVALGYSQWTDYNEHDPGTTAVIPDWFKTNAKWWKDGLITDADMVNALESLMIQDVIPLEKFVRPSSGIEHQGGVQKGGTFEIPSYQKDVFGFWSEGIVSDGEIVNSIGHLMSKGIINSEKIQEKREIFSETTGLELDVPPIEYREGDESTHVTKMPGIPKYGNITFKMGTIPEDALNKEFHFNIFETAKQNEVSMKYLQKIKSSEHNLAKDACDKATNDYSKNKNQYTMDIMSSYCNAESILEEESAQALVYYKTSVQLSEDAKEDAVDSGLHVLDLEDSVSEQQSKLDSIDGDFKTESEIKSAYKDAQKAQTLVDQGLQNTMSYVISENPEFQQLSSNDKNFVSATIGEITYSDFQITKTNDLEKSKPHLSDDGYFTPEGAFWVLMIDLFTKESGIKIVKEIGWGVGNTNDGYDFPENHPYNFLTSEGDYIVMLGTNHASTGDSIFDSPEEFEGNPFDFTSITITLPNGKTITMFQKLPEGTLKALANSDVVEGHKKLSNGEYCIFCGEPTQTESGENCIYCGEIDEPQEELQTYGETQEETIAEPTQEDTTESEDDGFTESGEVYVNGPFVNYYTGIWTLIVGNERHEFDTRDDALAALDELVEQFKATHSTVSESNSDESYVYAISAIQIGNLVYPAHQFALLSPSSGCSEQYLVLAYKTLRAYHINFDQVGLGPKTSGCGIASESEYEIIEKYRVTQEQALDWEERIGPMRNIQESYG